MAAHGENPYIGPRAFEEGDQEAFFGREQEIRRVASLVIARRVVLLYATSGAGKTSLLNAGLRPYLRQRKRMSSLPILRVGGDIPFNAARNRINNIYVFNALLTLYGDNTAPENLARQSLQQGLNAHIPKQSCLLIFDQFEELFTTHPERYQDREDFFRQLQECLTQWPRLSLLFSMREDYLAHLDSYAARLPDRLRTRLRLELLTQDAARQAIRTPAQQRGIEFDDEAIKHLVSELAKIQVQQPDGTMLPQAGQYIEPVQLQVACRRLWQQIPSETQRIEKTAIQHIGTIDDALSEYYTDQVHHIAEETGIHERSIREWFQNQLITDSGIRGQVVRGAEKSRGLEQNRSIEYLVDAHLIRSEQRLNATWYELAHDRLIEPVKQNNARWFETHLSTLQRRAKFWETEHRRDDLLLTGDLLKEAEQWAESPQNVLTDIEQEFLKSCQKARKHVEENQRKNRIIRWLAIIVSMCFVIAIYYAYQATQQKNRAEEISRISFAQNLAFQASHQFNDYQDDERAALLSLQAYQFSKKSKGYARSHVDKSLRTIFNSSYFSFILRGHHDDVKSIAFSPDGHFLVSGSTDQTVGLWAMADLNQEPLLFHEHSGTVWSVAFSPDGKKIISGSGDNTVRLWTLNDAGSIVNSIIVGRHNKSVRTVAFSPKGDFIASAGNDGIVKLWRNFLNAPPDSYTLTEHKDIILALAFSPDGNILATCGKDASIILWNLSNLNDISKEIWYQDTHKRRLQSIAFSPDNRYLAAGSDDTLIRIWDLTTPKAPPYTLEDHTSPVLSLMFSPDGKTLLSGSADNTVRIWDVTDLSDSKLDSIVLTGHSKPVYAVAFSANNQLIASGSRDDTIRLWESNKPILEFAALPERTSTIYSVQFSPDGQYLASGNKNGTVNVWNGNELSSQPDILPKLQTEDWIQAVAFNPVNSFLASGSKGGTIRIWELGEEPVVRHVLQGHTDDVTSLAFNRDGKLLASGSNDTTVRVWDFSQTEIPSTVLDIHKGGHTRIVWSVVFNPERDMLASASKDGTIRLWNIDRSPMFPEVLETHTDSVNSLAFSPNGRFLASGSDDTTVRLWEVTNSTSEVATLPGYEAILSVTFSSDGGSLASGSEDKTIRIWNLMNLDTEPIVLSGHEGAVTSVTFSPDDKKLISGSKDETIRIWNWQTESLAELVCQKVKRNLTEEEWRKFLSPTIPYKRLCP